MKLYGRQCDACETPLKEEDFDGPGSWNYTCPRCGFRYMHSSSKSVEEQVENYNKKLSI